MKKLDFRTRVELLLQSLDEHDIPYQQTGLEDYLVTQGFFTSPASASHHGTHEGGLFDHSYEVMTTLCDCTYQNRLKWKNDRSPIVVGLFHDLCKIDQYKHPMLDPLNWEYNSNILLKGHGDKSVMLLSQFITLTEEEIMCIRYHMGAFTEKEEWDDYTRAVKRHPNVLWTHHADMIASHVKGI